MDENKTATKGKEETAPQRKRPNYHRKFSVTLTPNRGERLRPVLNVLLKESITIASLAAKCGITRQGMNLRFMKDNCTLTDMEQMADALGYEFRWTFKRKK